MLKLIIMVCVTSILILCKINDMSYNEMLIIILLIGIIGIIEWNVGTQH